MTSTGPSTSGNTLSAGLSSYLESFVEDREVGQGVRLELAGAAPVGIDRFSEAYWAHIDALTRRRRARRAKRPSGALRLPGIGIAFVVAGLALAGKAGPVPAVIISTIGSFSIWEAAAIWLEPKGPFPYGSPHGIPRCAARPHLCQPWSTRRKVAVAAGARAVPLACALLIAHALAPAAPDAPASNAEERRDGWTLVLVNDEHPTGPCQPELTDLGGGQAIDSRCYQDLQRMFDAARTAGLCTWPKVFPLKARASVRCAPSPSPEPASTRLDLPST